ncbi:hypothetical protein RhiJN_13207 [Ceratobasidium sp. AG-Ba]|nr:hypothetical protein RhiJN_13207 [Ceratobasidium sp. AG-Ba]
MLGNLCLVKGDPYYDLMSSRLSQTKTGIVDLAIKMVPEEYNIKTLNLSPEIIEYNQSTVQYWLHEGNYTCLPKDFGALYERQIFTDILKNAFFASPNSTGVVHCDLFAVITIPTLAGVAAAVWTVS